ncbi:hypothetical protein D3C87_1061980 [compost metagenome]
MTIAASIRTSTKRPSLWLRVCILRRKGSMVGEARAPAIFPISVAMPVATTTARPRPRVTLVFMKAMFRRSARGSAVSPRGSGCLRLGTDSPVKADSSISRSPAWRIRASAAVRSPAVSLKRSPGTTSLAGITISSPSLTTVARGLVIWAKAWMACWALNSWMKPMAELRKTMPKMTMESISSPKSQETRATPKRT